MELFSVAKHKRGFVLFPDSMARATESGGASMC